MLTSKKTFCSLMLYSLMLLIFNVNIYSISSNPLDGVRIVGTLALIELLSFIVLNSFINGKIINFATLFMIVLFIFNFGQVVILLFFEGIYSHVRFLLLLTNAESFYGFKSMNLAFSLLSLGVLVSGIGSINHEITDKDISTNKKYDFEKVFKYVIAFTFPVKAAIDVFCLIVSIVSGASAARQWLNAFPNVLTDYGRVSVVAFALLLIIYKNSHKKQKRLFLFIETYILIMMISGIRSENVVYVLVFFFIYVFNRKKKVRILSLIIYGVIAFFALSFVVASGEFRAVPEKNFFSFMSLLYKCMTEENVVLSLLDTCGDTGYTAQCVVNKWLPYYGTSNGDAYYLGWTSVIPNIPGLFTLPGELTRESCFAIKLQEMGALSSSYTNIGGSLIGELFFNFGIVGGSIAAGLLGFIIGKVSNKSTYYMQNNNYAGLIRHIPFMFACTYWIRDYFGGIFREIVWGPLIIWVIIMVFKPNFLNNKLQKRND